MFNPGFARANLDVSRLALYILVFSRNVAQLSKPVESQLSRYMESCLEINVLKVGHQQPLPLVHDREARCFHHRGVVIGKLVVEKSVCLKLIR